MSDVRVLLVDDDRSVQLTLAANLELSGFEVETASDFDEAFQRFSTGTFDVLVSDFEMPGLTGLDLFEAVRRARPDIPMVMITGCGEEDVIENALQRGAFTVIPKPLDPDLVIEILNAAMRKPQVLVVDDSVAHAQTLSACLTDAGLEVVTVHDGQAALESMEDARVDVCILDLVMPGMDGVETFRRMREKNSGVVVIACTGHEVADLATRVLGEGAYDCLRKPVDVVGLVRLISRARARVPHRHSQWS